MLKHLRLDIFELQETKLTVRLINTTNERNVVQGYEIPLRVKGDFEDVFPVNWTQRGIKFFMIVVLFCLFNFFFPPPPPASDPQSSSNSKLREPEALESLSHYVSVSLRWVLAYDLSGSLRADKEECRPKVANETV
ncbi:hypothetical protein TNCV_4969131 [Trichonephila clavipes]|nr:hypothetical protein TNCV_4969131 [Trichonephila clavipes]